MIRFGDAMTIVMHVMLRKSMSIYDELAYVLGDIFWILNSVVRFSGMFVSRRSNSISSRHYSPMSSMLVRPDR
ncbi:hypothetical protein RND71_038460 [Anisodus tanguticus]|uniref:Uncharacterized protein n=1 Tax=Anisodus tanguticus TaxID=243964 RepID=A0AAE1QZ34_9SOLA|nr:hypothetical protein RND71_038460 [Anisodus tanguticus]